MSVCMLWSGLGTRIILIAMIQCPQVERENAACPDLDEGPKQQAILIILMGWSVLYLILESKMKEAFLCKNDGSILGLLFLWCIAIAANFCPILDRIFPSRAIERLRMFKHSWSTCNWSWHLLYASFSNSVYHFSCRHHEFRQCNWHAIWCQFELALSAHFWPFNAISLKQYIVQGLD